MDGDGKYHHGFTALIEVALAILRPMQSVVVLCFHTAGSSAAPTPQQQHQHHSNSTNTSTRTNDSTWKEPSDGGFGSAPHMASTSHAGRATCPSVTTTGTPPDFATYE